MKRGLAITWLTLVYGTCLVLFVLFVIDTWPITMAVAGFGVLGMTVLGFCWLTSWAWSEVTKNWDRLDFDRLDFDSPNVETHAMHLSANTGDAQHVAHTTPLAESQPHSGYSRAGQRPDGEWEWCYEDDGPDGPPRVAHHEGDGKEPT